MVARRKVARQVTARAKRWRAPVADVPMRPLRAQRATIVPVPALVDRKAGVVPKADVGWKADVVPKAGVDQKVDVDPKADAGRKADAGPKADAGRKTGAAQKTGAVLKVDAVPKTAVNPRAVAVLKAGAVQTVVVVPDDVRSQEWSSLSVRQFPAARLTRLGSRLQAFQFGRLRRQNPDHVAVLVAKGPMVPVAVPVAPADLVVLLVPAVPAVPAAALPHVVIANFATCANRGRHTSKFFTSSACFSM